MHSRDAMILQASRAVGDELYSDFFLGMAGKSLHYL
jgi:hypothetical protein